MRMHNPAHPAEVIRESCLKPLGMTVTATAEGLGVTRKALSDLPTGIAAFRRKWRSACKRRVGAPRTLGCARRLRTVCGKRESRRTRSGSADFPDLRRHSARAGKLTRNRYAERRPVAILAADIVGYPRVMVEDENRTWSRLRRSDLIDPAIAMHHRRAIKRPPRRKHGPEC